MGSGIYERFGYARSADNGSLFIQDRQYLEGDWGSGRVISFL
jgi:hypothetical protein